MRVLEVANNLGPGGRTKVIADLVAGLKGHGLEVRLATISACECGPEFLEALGAPCLDLAWGGQGLDLSLMRRLRGLMRREGVQVVHAHDGASQFYAFAAAKTLPGVRTVYTFHRGHLVDNRDWSDLARNKLLDLFTDRYVFVSAERRDFYCRRNHISLAKAEVIYNGVDVELCRQRAPQGTPCRARLGLSADATLLGAVGALKPAKALDVLLRSLPEVIKQVPKAHLVVVGEGPERPRLEALARELGLEGRVSLVGHRQDVLDWINALDIFVMPPRADGFSLVFVEAMACGKPVVASRVGGIPEAVVEGQTGLLVPPEDPQALARAVIRLCADPQEAARLGQAGAVRAAKHFQVAGMVERYRQALTRW